jgi:hypothetical protein
MANRIRGFLFILEARDNRDKILSGTLCVPACFLGRYVCPLACIMLDS